MKLLPAIVAISLCVPGSARAEKIVVFPPTSKIDKAIVDAVVKSAREKNSAVLSSVTLDEIAIVTGCSIDAARCRKKILLTVGADSALAISSRAGDPSTITIERIKKNGERKTKSVKVGADAVAAVRLASTELITGEKPVEPPPPRTEPVVATTKPDPDPVRRSEPPAPTPTPSPPVAETAPLPNLEPEPTERGFALKRIRLTTWAVLGGGVASLATGVVFLSLAQSRQSDIDEAPTDTIEDIRRLVELEDSAMQRSALGFAFVGFGVAALAVGGVLAARDGRRPPTATMAIGASDDGFFATFGGQF